MISVMIGVQLRRGGALVQIQYRPSQPTPSGMKEPHDTGRESGVRFAPRYGAENTATGQGGGVFNLALLTLENGSTVASNRVVGSTRLAALWWVLWRGGTSLGTPRMTSLPSAPRSFEGRSARALDGRLGFPTKAVLVFVVRCRCTPERGEMRDNRELVSIRRGQRFCKPL